MRSKKIILAEIRALRANEANYVTSIERADPYSLVAEHMLKLVPDTVVFAGMSFKEVRAYCKKPIMTAMYNSVAQPQEAFGEDTPELNAFYETLNHLFPGAMNVLEALNDRWDKQADYHTFKCIDGHVAYMPVINTIEGTLSVEGLELPYIYKEQGTSDVGTSLAPNFVHANDGYLVRFVVESANAEGFIVTAIHDQFDTHPNNVWRVKELYAEGIRRIAESRLLEEFCEQDFGIDVTDFVAKTYQATYHIC
jgi:hypothetical protein